jgi:hypothetical protein
MGAQ